MKEKIGETAGKIWKLLREKGEVDVSRLPRLLNEKTLYAYLALGWLTRENKVEYRRKAEKIFVSLVESER